MNFKAPGLVNHTPNLKCSRLQSCWFPGVLDRVLAASRDQVETLGVQGFTAAGIHVQARVVVAIRDQVATPKLEDCKPSGLLVSRCPGQGVSGNRGPSGNP